MAASSYYSPEEDTLIRVHYPIATLAEMLELLPGRTAQGIRVRASRLGVLKKKDYYESGISLEGSVIGNLTEAEKGYLAGIIDGEGCIRLARRKGSNGTYIYHIYISITNTSPNLHDWLEGKLPGKGYIHKSSPREDRRPWSNPEQWKPSYNWIVSGNRVAIVLLREIAPYLVIKREQAETLAKGYVHLSEAERESLFQRLYELKKTS